MPFVNELREEGKRRRHTIDKDRGMILRAHTTNREGYSIMKFTAPGVSLLIDAYAEKEIFNIDGDLKMKVTWVLNAVFDPNNKDFNPKEYVPYIEEALEEYGLGSSKDESITVAVRNELKR